MFFPRYGLIMPKKMQQKSLVSSKLSVFADDSDEEVSSTIFFPFSANNLFTTIVPASASSSSIMIFIITWNLGVKCDLFSLAQLKGK